MSAEANGRILTELAVNGAPPVRTEPFRPHGVLGAAEQEAACAVIRSNNLFRFGGGEHAVERLEAKLAERYAGRHATAMNSGTSALHAALAASGISPGDEVIVPALTWFSTATACLHQGAVPVFADVDPTTAMVTVESVAARITDRTRAVIVVHLFGYPADIARLRALADGHGLVLIEDCAQALGSRVNGQNVGTFGHVGAFSLQQSKGITTGDGGFTITQSTELARRAAMFTDHGLDRSTAEGPQFLGYNYRMTELQGAVASVQLDRLDEFNERRRQNVRLLIDGLAEVPGLRLPRWDADSEPAWWLFSVRLDVAQFAVTRDEFVAALRAEGIPASVHPRRPVYLEPLFVNKSTYSRSQFPIADAGVVYRPGLCEVAEQYLQSQIAFPCHHALDKDDMTDIVIATRKVTSAFRQQS